MNSNYGNVLLLFEYMCGVCVCVMVLVYAIVIWEIFHQNDNDDLNDDVIVIEYSQHY